MTARIALVEAFELWPIRCLCGRVPSPRRAGVPTFGRDHEGLGWGGDNRETDFHPSPDELFSGDRRTAATRFGLWLMRTVVGQAARLIGVVNDLIRLA